MEDEGNLTESPDIRQDYDILPLSYHGRSQCRSREGADKTLVADAKYHGLNGLSLVEGKRTSRHTDGTPSSIVGRSSTKWNFSRCAVPEWRIPEIRGER